MSFAMGSINLMTTKEVDSLATKLDTILDHPNTLDSFVEECLQQFRAILIREIRFRDMCESKNQKLREEETNE